MGCPRAARAEHDARMSTDGTGLAGARRLVVSKPFAVTSRYDVHAADADGEQGAFLAAAVQKPFSLREQVTFFSDERHGTPIFSLRSRGIVVVSATYDVLGADDVPLGTVRRQGAVLSPPVWVLDSPAVSALGQQVDGLTAFWRRASRSGRSFYDLELLDAQHAVVLACGRRPGLRQSYLVEIRDPRVDGRLGACVAVTLDLARRRNQGSDGGASTSGTAAVVG